MARTVKSVANSQNNTRLNDPSTTEEKEEEHVQPLKEPVVVPGCRATVDST